MARKELIAPSRAAPCGLDGIPVLLYPSADTRGGMLFLDRWSARLVSVIVALLRDSQWEEAARAPSQQLKIPAI
jgi:hypothetical protein